MTGPQPHRDFPPRESWSVRICWWAIGAVIMVGFCGIVWIASVGLADAVWAIWETIG